MTMTALGVHYRGAGDLHFCVLFVPKSTECYWDVNLIVNLILFLCPRWGRTTQLVVFLIMTKISTKNKAQFLLVSPAGAGMG